MASPTQWTWVWVNSGSWWWTGRPGVLQFMGSQRVEHDWATELNWTELNWWDQMHDIHLLNVKFYASFFHSPLSPSLRGSLALLCFLPLVQSVSSVAQLCPNLCDPMDCSTPSFPVHHQMPELAQTQAHWSVTYPTISSSVVPFSCLQSFPTSGSFTVNQFFTSGGQSIGVSASASVLPVNI